MSRRKWAVGSFVPCSPRHHHCSPAHAALVRGYREERERQETANETVLTARGEREFWKANGGKLITFKTWLKANKKVEKWVSTKSNPIQVQTHTVCVERSAEVISFVGQTTDDISVRIATEKKIRYQRKDATQRKANL
jgi:hypothetical protein